MKRFINRERRGAFVVLTALLLVFVFVMLSFAIDLGYIAVVQSELQNAADAAALAGAAATTDGTDSARTEALKFATLNRAGGRDVAETEASIRFGRWDTTSRTFVESTDDPAAIEVVLSRQNQGLFFAKVLGNDAFDAQAEAIATFQPRDIVLVLDYSGSMSYDSQFRQIGALGQSAVESNLYKIYGELGSPTFGSMQWNPVYISSTNSNTIRNTLGLQNVSYPYSGGSWNDYFDYVQNDSQVNNAGYRKRYGYKTWVNYVLAENYSYSQNPNLWSTTQQPLTAVKNAVDVLLAYIEENSPDDQVGMSLYTSSNGKAVLESGLTKNYSTVSSLARHRQAGHYQAYTNIYDGMRTGRLELQNNARAGSQRMLVLMTDGQANRPSNESTGRSMALQEAQTCADARIPIVTIALGAGADTDLMSSIADMTGGAYFEIPGGQTVAEYEEQLKEVFKRVAGDRSLTLVK